MKTVREETKTNLLYAGIIIALLPVFLLRDFTPANELRYLSIADEALHNRTFFAFTNHGIPYADKPPLYFWALMLFRYLTGEFRMWMVAILSLLPALGVVRTMDSWTRSEVGHGYRLPTQLMLLSCGLFLGAAVVLRMDMLMCLFIVLSLREFWKMQRREKYRRQSRWLFPVFLFLAVLTKGPLGLIIPLCASTIFLFVSGRIGEITRYWGMRTWSVLLVCCTLWFAAVYAEGGDDYLCNLLFRQTVGRAVDSFHHAGPFYYYAGCFWYILAPWSLLIAGTLVSALCRWREQTELQRFFLVVSMATFVVLSCISSKLEIYLLPAIPFMVYNVAMSLPRVAETVWGRVALIIPALSFALSLPACFVAKMMIADMPAYPSSWQFLVVAAILTAGGIAALFSLFGNRGIWRMTRAVLQMGLSLFLALFCGGLIMSELNAHIGYGALCDKALQLSHDKGITDIRTWRVPRAENMNIYLRRPVKVLSGDDIPASDTVPHMLLTRLSCQKYFSGHEVHAVGSYAVVVFSRKNNNGKYFIDQ